MRKTIPRYDQKIAINYFNLKNGNYTLVNRVKSTEYSNFGYLKAQRSPVDLQCYQVEYVDRPDALLRSDELDQ